MAHELLFVNDDENSLNIGLMLFSLVYYLLKMISLIMIFYPQNVKCHK